MFLDLNITYTQASPGQRVGMALSHVLDIPERVFNTIIQLAKAILLSVGSALCFCQSSVLNNEVRLALGRTMKNLVGIFFSTVGFFLPVNATNWQVNQKPTLNFGNQPVQPPKTIPELHLERHKQDLYTN